MSPLVALVLALNLGAFLLFGWDKLASVRRARRVPEGRLLLAALALGAAGAWLGVVAFRHKSSKPSFLARLALATLGSLAIAWAFVGRGRWPA
jgi:uncharacterized membrane protein YsdA (DUF1294 family)